MKEVWLWWNFGSGAGVVGDDDFATMGVLQPTLGGPLTDKHFMNTFGRGATNLLRFCCNLASTCLVIEWLAVMALQEAWDEETPSPEISGTR